MQLINAAGRGRSKEGGRGGGTCPLLEFENLMSFAAVLHHTLYIVVYNVAKTLKVSLAPLARRKVDDVLNGAPKKCEAFKVSLVFCTLPGQISAGTTAAGTSNLLASR